MAPFLCFGAGITSPYDELRRLLLIDWFGKVTGAMLRAEMEEHGVSVEELSKATGVTLTSLQRYVREPDYVITMVQVINPLMRFFGGTYDEQLDIRPTISVRQVRAARAMLGWTQAVLAEKSGVSAQTVKRLEVGEGLLGGSTQTVLAIHSALHSEGIDFIGNGKDMAGTGVRLRWAVQKKTP